MSVAVLPHQPPQAADEASAKALLDSATEALRTRRLAEVAELRLAIQWAVVQGHARDERDPLVTPGGDGTPAGGSRVWRVVPGQRPTVFRGGFSAITDGAFGRDGSLYVLELTTDPSTFGPTGAIVRVKPNGTRSVIGRDVLHYPGGMEIGAGGSIFVSNWSVLPAFPQAGSPFGNARGQVIRLTP